VGADARKREKLGRGGRSRLLDERGYWHARRLSLGTGFNGVSGAKSKVSDGENGTKGRLCGMGHDWTVPSGEKEQDLGSRKTWAGLTGKRFERREVDGCREGLNGVE
jgi:hypothetical protein